MEIDKEKVVGYVKTYATIAKDKIVATWKSGAKGKFACIVGAVIILLGLKSCLTTSGSNTEGGENKSRLGPQYQFTAADFATESGTDALFYVKDGEDDGYKDVVPNLRRVPEMLAKAPPITEGYRPQNNPGVGNVFFTDPDACFQNGMSTVTHVDDGWIVARTDWRDMYGDYSGFIYTQETYIEGQKLRAGYYVLIGTQKVPLVNGSSKTMFAFLRIDDESNRLALEAKSHNERAREAAERENNRRDEFGRCRDDFMKNVGQFKIVNFEEQIHLPTELKGKENCFHLLNEDELVENFTANPLKISFGKLKQCIDNKDFDLYCKLFSSKPKIFCPHYLGNSHYESYTRAFDIKGAEDWERKYNFYVIRQRGAGGGRYSISKLYYTEPEPPYKLSLDACLCVVDKSNKEVNSILEKSSPEKEDVEKALGKIFSAGFWIDN